MVYNRLVACRHITFDLIVAFGSLLVTAFCLNCSHFGLPERVVAVGKSMTNCIMNPLLKDVNFARPWGRYFHANWIHEVRQHLVRRRPVADGASGTRPIVYEGPSYT